jgi:predicted small secreted protein
MTRIWVALGLMLIVAGCETIEGAGQDIESAGQAITEESQEAQAGM